MAPGDAMLLMVVVAVMGTTIATEIPLENTWHMMQCPGGGPLQYFLLHSEGTAIMVDQTQPGNVQPFANGSVVFRTLNVTYEGTHICMMGKETEGLHAYPVHLRVRPLPPTDLWAAMYESMFLTGLIAALVIAFIFTLGCFVYKKRWRPILEDERRVIGYDNPTMHGAEDDPEANSTKM